MARKAQLTIDIEAKLAAEFSAAAHSAQVSETEILLEMVQDYVERQKIDGAYRQFLETKVAKGRADIAAGNIVSAEETERRFADRRRQAKRLGDHQ